MFELRPATDADLTFIESLFRSVRGPEFELAGLDGDALDSLLAMQFRGQRTHYAKAYPERLDYLIIRDGAPIGEWLIAELPKEFRLVDISLLPEHRGLGIGTQLVTGLLESAQKAGKAVVLHVEMQNPAKRLYDRLGFIVEEEVGLYWRMRWVSQ